MPSQPQNKARKSLRGSRRLTTLSFESIDKIGQGVFTEDISSSSRIARPSYVLRHGDVVGANMPETIKLAKHKGKIYVGLNDTLSVCSGNRADGRSLSIERSSAATTIGRASIIDWTDNASEVSGKMPLSGELSVMLPPVPGAQQTNYVPPGLDTSDIFNYRSSSYINTSSIHKKQADKSPRPPPSRSGTRYVGGFRPPQNTPFLLPTRPDEFSASIRKKLSPKSPRDSSSVMILGGSITPLVTSKQGTRKSFMSRESTFMTERGRSKQSQRSKRNLGTANFDLPMIDLKCIESPVPSLGNLEEKGIRLVKLRRVRGSKKKSVSQNSDGRNGNSSDTNTTPNEDTSKRSSLNEDLNTDLTGRSSSFIPLPPPSTREQSMAKSPVATKIHLEKTISEKPSEGDTRQSPKSVTSSPSEVFAPNDEPDRESQIGTNREPYSTPLLPDIMNSSRAENRANLSSPVIQVNSEPVNDVVVPPPFQLNVVKVDATPEPPTPIPDQPEEEFELPGRARAGKRSSSLLSVPASDLSEIRPRLSASEEEDNDGVMIGTHHVTVEAATPERRLSRTIATQTSQSADDVSQE